MTKTPALSALHGFGVRVGRSDRGCAGKKSDGFAEPGNMKWVDCYNHRGGALLGPISRI